MALSTAKPDQKDEISRLHARYRLPLQTFFLRRVGSASEAEDLVQEVFVRILSHQNDERYVFADGLIFTIAANLLRDRSRRRRARAADAHFNFETEMAGGGHPALTELREPEREMVSRQSMAQLLVTLSAMPTRTRDIFLLYRLEGMKQRDIAALYGISVSAVEKQIVKALGRLAREQANDV